MTTTTPATAAGAAVAARPFRLGRHAIFAVAAAAANALVFTIGSGAGASMSIDSPGYSQITLALSIVATLAPLLIAGLVTWLIAGRRPGFRRIAQWLGLAVAVLSIISPFIVAMDTATAVSLAAMHVFAGAAWFFGVAPDRRTR